MEGDNNYLDSVGGHFRHFVNNMFYAAMREREYYHQETCTLEEYFTNNKYWLKEKFKETGGNMIDITN
jgi:hypothetical protein